MFRRKHHQILISHPKRLIYMSTLQITINTLVTMFSQRKMCRTECSIVLILKIPIFDIQVLYTFVKYEIIFVVRIL